MLKRTPDSVPAPRAANRRLVVRLVGLVVGMFGFGFALIPLYDLLCEVTGLGGKTAGAYTYSPAQAAVDVSRTIPVRFVTNTNDGMPWRFWSETGGVRVHPGELTEAKFYVTNTTSRRMVGQAVPSVAPAIAAEHFQKTECFCFESQVLEPGETLEMPVRFMVASALPRHVQSIALSYSLFDVTELAAAQGGD